MMLAGLSPRKAAMALYGVAGFEGAEGLLTGLGRYTRGRGCFYIKRLQDVAGVVLRALIVESVARTRVRHAGSEIDGQA